ncbi:MAG: hypothetical protein DRN04_17565 [Thermoprotei archaeon]|nr:MAG: hypothetical protein DRN04_17565 [Thermoprotei archaeon]
MALTVEEVVREVRRRVIEWEKEHWVPYPWRVDRTPYKVLVAEMLLKRTTRQAVAREYPKFISKFPDIISLYNAPVEEVESALLHLGLYKQRARQLKDLAKLIVEQYGGRIPDNWDDLVRLPGIGVYLAGAILSFGYNKPAPVVDSNVIRLLSRLTGLQSRRADDYLEIMSRLVPEKDHDLFNYGAIDLGALICHYRTPKCDECPLKDLCVYESSRADKAKASALRGIYQRLLSRMKGLEEFLEK